METNAENRIEVCEARSYARCIWEGVSMAADHVGVVMKHTWPAMLLSLIIPFPGLLVYMGGLDRLLCEWRQEGYVPAHKPLNGLRKDVWRMTRVLARMTFVSLIVIVVLAITWAASTYLPYGMWMGLLALVVLSLLLMPSVMVLMDMACTEKPIGLCMNGWLKGYQHYGSLFAFRMLLFMLSMVILIPGMIPATLASLVTQKAWDAIQAGDLISMPPALPLVILGADLITGLTMLIITTIRSFSQMLFWGSIQNREMEENRESEE